MSDGYSRSSAFAGQSVSLMRGALFMRTSRIALTLAGAALLVSCGGDDAAPRAVTPSPTAPAPSPTGQCSLAARQDFALTQLQEWYLFPDLLDTDVNKAAFSTVEDYIDALVAPARAQSRDRFFTYLTSIAEEDAFYEEGESAGFGFRLSYDVDARKVFVIEAFEDTSALGAGVDRGTEILAIGEPNAPLQTVDTLLVNGDAFAVVDALGPVAPGTMRTLRVRDQNGVEREISLTKTSYRFDPVSDRYGIKIIEDDGKRVGYINLRTFIDTAQGDLVDAFGQFQAQGITELIVDLRYNGGGLISIAELMGDLMGAERKGQVFDRLTFRPSKSDENESYVFNPRNVSIQPTRVAFIGTESTASASELVINGMQPYLGRNMALIGENTFGKPVGQIALDLAACDDRLRLVAFNVQNANRQGDYYTGLAATVPNTCAANDDLAHQLGDPQEAMVAGALDFLAGRSCTPISASQARTASLEAPRGRRADTRTLLRREDHGTIGREAPGVF